MSFKEKRKHARVDSLNLLNYLYFDSDGKEISQGMGRTLNVSEAGIRLETHHSLDISQRMSLNIGIEEETVDIDGKVVFCDSNDNGKFECGIEFLNPPNSSWRVLKKFIKAFNESRRKQNPA